VKRARHRSAGHWAHQRPFACASKQLKPIRWGAKRLLSGSGPRWSILGIPAGVPGLGRAFKKPAASPRGRRLQRRQRPATSPGGMNGRLVKAWAAAQAGKTPAAVEELRKAADRGFDRFFALPNEPSFAGIRNGPGFHALVLDLAGKWIAMARVPGYDSQPAPRAHLLRGEYQAVVSTLERAVFVADRRTSSHARSSTTRAQNSRNRRLQAHLITRASPEARPPGRGRNTKPRTSPRAASASLLG
jgi:hypothetical protein